MGTLLLTGIASAEGEFIVTENNGSLSGLGYARSHDFPVTADIFNVEVSAVDTLGNRSVQVKIPVNDLDTGNAARTKHMQISVLDRKNFPYIIFTSQFTLLQLGPGEVRMPGMLELNGLSNPHEIVVTLAPEGDQYRATGTFQVKLSDYDLPRVGMGPMKLLDKVDLNLDVRF